jgi:hypothetical protein
MAAWYQDRSACQPAILAVSSPARCMQRVVAAQVARAPDRLAASLDGKSPWPGKGLPPSRPLRLRFSIREHVLVVRGGVNVITGFVGIRPWSAGRGQAGGPACAEAKAGRRSRKSEIRNKFEQSQRGKMGKAGRENFLAACERFGQLQCKGSTCQTRRIRLR